MGLLGTFNSETISFCFFDQNTFNGWMDRLVERKEKKGTEEKYRMGDVYSRGQPRSLIIAPSRGKQGRNLAVIYRNNGRFGTFECVQYLYNIQYFSFSRT